MIDHVQDEGSRLRGLSLFKQGYMRIRDLLFPPQCADCGRVGLSYCAHCQETLESWPLQLLERTDSTLQGLASTGFHQGQLQTAIHALKYYDATYIAPILAERLARGIEAHLGWPIDVIAPIPMHAQRQKQRGYNQAQLIAEALARQLGKPCDVSLIKRTRFTRSQVGLNRAERLDNLQGAFTADPTRTRGQRILLVDDVLTTGATLSNCATTLQEAEALAVFGLTVSQAKDLRRF